MTISAKTLGIALAAMTAATIAFAHADSAQATDSNANRTPKGYPTIAVCTTWAAKTADGVTHKNCIKKSNCVCPPGYH
jgi:hypothetical protein